MYIEVSRQMFNHNKMVAVMHGADPDMIGEFRSAQAVVEKPKADSLYEMNQKLPPALRCNIRKKE